MRAPPTFRPAFGDFPGDSRGGVAVWFGLSAVALLFMAGSGMDLARSINQKVEIQGAVDSAALAGAGVYTSTAQLAAATAAANNYMAQFKTASGITSLTYTATPGVPNVDSNGSVTSYPMTVTASSSIDNTLMKMAKSSNVVGATATALNPVYNITIKSSGFSSSAVDSDTISYYMVPADGSTPTTTTQLYTNVGSSSGSGTVTIQTTASQKIGFMLTNVTDGNAVTTCTRTWWGSQSCSSSNYGSNQYGGASGSTHYFYSHMMPPSKLAYPSVTQNCSLQVLTNTTAKPSSGCSSSLPAYATVNCVQASGMTLYFWWNDMGGTTDDKDYNDAAYSVTCSSVSNTMPKGLVLTQ